MKRRDERGQQRGASMILRPSKSQLFAPLAFSEQPPFPSRFLSDLPAISLAIVSQPSPTQCLVLQLQMLKCLSPLRHSSTSSSLFDRCSDGFGGREGEGEAPSPAGCPSRAAAAPAQGNSALSQSSVSAGVPAEARSLSPPAHALRYHTLLSFLCPLLALCSISVGTFTSFCE